MTRFQLILPGQNQKPPNFSGQTKRSGLQLTVLAETLSCSI